MQTFRCVLIVRRLAIFICTATLVLTAVAQTSRSAKKYPSLFWEISGNGLKKPSYLFGTMHVSSKMVFHLSDSFYHAMRNTDAVALELNPEVWQDQMFRLQKAQLELSNFSRPAMNDYINEESFRFRKYDDDLKRALREEPTVVNSLLYRSYQARADFEENTYLDLYIYQTGRKLGKQPAGVEDYMESERIMLEAYADMAKEKTKKSIDTDGESMYDLEKRMQDAYRKGDLDLMDSLQKLTETSPAFTEKFLYLRNEIQANSIDSILKIHSLFVGVGAAHLPGERGVIELLRKKGYHLRPIFMQDRDAEQKEKIDRLKVPVHFETVTTGDGQVQLQLPGKLYKREDSKSDSWQYADMNNGSYYMLTRVRTHGAFAGFTQAVIARKVDSLLYENIPGKIVKKEVITKNGLPGFDITNKTRRGDMQRYEILVTPFEVLVFKMSGTDTYVLGKEADSFFNSIVVKSDYTPNWARYQPAYGGFTVQFPHIPSVALTRGGSDKIDRWDYEAVDEKTGNAYLVWKKTVYNFNFVEEDTFDLGLIEESFRGSDLISKRTSRHMGTENGVPFIESKYLLKNGGYLQTKAFIKGPHYYLLAARTTKPTDASPFFSSFAFTPYKYPAPVKYKDELLNLEVMTAVTPNLDTNLRSWIEKATNEETLAAATGNFSYWPKSKTGVFRSEETGEAIFVTAETFPKYYYSRDTAKFWRDRMDLRNISRDMIVKANDYIVPADGTSGYRLLLTDTNSSRMIVHHFLLKDNVFFRISTITDTLTDQSSFIKQFLATGKPIEKKYGPSVFDNKLDQFFADYYSSDSLVKTRAAQSISNIYFGKDGIDKIVNAISRLQVSDKDYFDLKTKFINELGYIDDSCCSDRVVAILKDIYNKSSDTSMFQNAALVALARLKTKTSFSAVKDILVQDPPVFESGYEYSRLFSHFSDTLALAKDLFPALLPLAAIEDYKGRINNLLRQLVDSGYIQKQAYETYFSQLAFDAKIQLKKQLAKDDKRMEQQGVQDDAMAFARSLFGSLPTTTSNISASLVYDYSVLLMPYYDSNAAVAAYFKKLLQSKDPDVQLSAAVLMIRNNKSIPDTLLESIAARDNYRAKLLARLQQINRADLFPAKYKTQQLITRSLLLNDKNAAQFADIQLVNKRVLQVKGKTGVVYLYKYKMKAEDDWRMGISGLQPVDEKQVNTSNLLVKMTDKKLKTDEPINDQYDQQVKELLFAQHKSGRNFFVEKGYNLFGGAMNDMDDFEE